MLVIDGYNLLFAVFGQSIRSIETTREELLELLTAYCVKHRRRATVFFDSGRSGDVLQHSRTVRRGDLTVIYTARGETADDAIIEHVRKVRDKKSITVVTSDLKILKAAEQVRVGSEKSEDFSNKLAEFLRQSRSIYEERKTKGISSAEAECWMREFKISEDDLKDLLEE